MIILAPCVRATYSRYFAKILMILLIFAYRLSVGKIVSVSTDIRCFSDISVNKSDILFLGAGGRHENSCSFSVLFLKFSNN